MDSLPNYQRNSSPKRHYVLNNKETQKLTVEEYKAELKRNLRITNDFVNALDDATDNALITQDIYCKQY